MIEDDVLVEDGEDYRVRDHDEQSDDHADKEMGTPFLSFDLDHHPGEDHQSEDE